MTIIIGKHEFKGPVTKSHIVAEVPGLYAVLYHNDADLALMQIAESENLSKTVDTLKGAENTSIVVLGCADRQRRGLILNELLQEYDYEDALEPITLNGFSAPHLQAVAY
jgi:hypothetical protein